MKKINKILLTAIALVFAIPVIAQEQYLHIYNGGSREKSYLLSSVDSMLIEETAAGSYMDLYNKGQKHRVGNIANIDEFRVGGAVLPSGIYMGVIGFNSELYTKPIGSLSGTTQSDYTSFVNGLTSSDGTILYYGVEQALEALNNTALPEDLLNVTLVTFTDGLDKGSHQKNKEHGGSNDVYLTSLNNSIKNDKIQNIPINAYSIGLRGDNVSDIAQFQKNLQYLASSADKAVEVTDISEVNTKFQEIADAIYKESVINTVKLRVPGDADGTKFRFVFDDVTDVNESAMYIEGTFRWIDNALVDVTYHGLTCDNGSIVVGEAEENDVFITYTFENVVTSTPIEQNDIKHWFTNSSGNWERNSEFTPNSNSALEVTRKSALIMLVLDCSSSLGTQFSTVKTHANNFIGTLAGYGNDEGFTAVDISFGDFDVFAQLEKDEMIAVKGGTFTMGATSEQGSDYGSDELPTHQVTLSDYYIGKYEVTQQLWEYVMSYSGTAADGTTMSAYASDVWLGTNPSSSDGVGYYYPAYYVSYDDIVNTFLPRLNKITGKTFRLPTEAEWEYAARGGNKSKGYKYSGSNTIGDVAWYTGNSSSTTHEVGTKSPNELGIYDMSGNVWEWCSDWYGNYSSSSQTNPTGPTSGSYRVARGGGWINYAQICRVSGRGGGFPDSRGDGLGFRLAL